MRTAGALGALAGGAEVKRWTAVEVELLRRHFADTRTDDLARALGRAYTAVANKAANLGLKKSTGYLASPDARRFDGRKGMGTRFLPGQQPWNAGLHYQPGGRCAESQFKRGTLNGRAAQLAQPIGAYRVNADGYLDQKISDEPGPQTRRWRAVHRLVWEAAHGPVPAGHAVCFLPGRATVDPALITLDALELVTRAELMRRNTFHRYGKEVAQLVQLRGAITRQINKRQKDQA